MSDGSLKKTISKKAVALFSVIAVFWFIVDRISKFVVDQSLPGTVIVDDVLNMFEFRLIHNTGAAWGMFADSTQFLGILSLVLCAVVIWFLFAIERGGHLLELIGSALVFAGGLGNAFDRLFLGYVVDFINCTFVQFPVFNIADIGVTCGIVIFFIGLLMSGEKDESGLGEAS